MDRGGCGEAFCDIENARLIHCADHPEATACLTTSVIKLAAFCIDVLDRGDLAFWRIERGHEATITCDAGSVNCDSLARQIWMIWTGSHSAHPDGFCGVGHDFALTLYLSITSCFGFRHPARKGHLIGWAELATNVCAPCDFDSSAPASKASGWDSIRIGHIPAGFVMPWLAFCSAGETVHLAIEDDFLWRCHPSRRYCIAQLKLWWIWLDRFRWRPRPTKDVCEISHYSPFPLR